MTRTCSTCKFWRDQDHCDRIELFMRFDSPGRDPKEPAEIELRADDDSGMGARLMTNATFGCTLHIARTPEGSAAAHGSIAALIPELRQLHATRPESVGRLINMVVHNLPTLLDAFEERDSLKALVTPLVEAMSPLLMSELGSMPSASHVHAVVSNVSCEQVQQMRVAIAAVRDLFEMAAQVKLSKLTEKPE